MNFHVHSAAPPKGSIMTAGRRAPKATRMPPKASMEMRAQGHLRQSPTPVASPQTPKQTVTPENACMKCPISPMGRGLFHIERMPPRRAERAKDHYLAGNVFHLPGKVCCAVQSFSPWGTTADFTVGGSWGDPAQTGGCLRGKV